MTQRRRLKIAPEVESAGAIIILRKHHHMTCLTDHRVLLLSANRCLFLAKFLSLSTSGSLIMPASGYKNRPRARTRLGPRRRVQVTVGNVKRKTTGCTSITRLSKRRRRFSFASFHLKNWPSPRLRHSQDLDDEKERGKENDAFHLIKSDAVIADKTLPDRDG